MYPDYRALFEALPGDEAKALLLSLFEYAETRECIELPPRASMAFITISQRIERDQAKYSQTCERRKEAGKKGGRPRKTNIEEKQTKAKKPNGFPEKQKNQMQAKKANNSNKDSSNDKDNDILKKRYTVGQNPTPPYKDIIDYLNLKTDSKYKYTTKATRRIINGRYEEGFTLEDFKSVIDIKSAQWKGDNKMSAYLRPETLFAASHFESYLNEGRQLAPPEEKYPGLRERLAAETDKNLSGSEDYGEFN